MNPKLKLLKFIGLLSAVACLSATTHAEASKGALQRLPDWLNAHVGAGSGEIAPKVLERGVHSTWSRFHKGKVRNACYFAMDATRPNDLTDGPSGGRFYIICEGEQSFQAISSGHGGGRNLPGGANFTNGRQCAKNFGNALNSNLTAGGAYLTSEIKTSFKGYYSVSPKQDAFLTRSFVQFDGIGETANARQRAIGGHASALVSGICMMKNPNSPFADRDGYVPRGKLTTYAGGRSDGCTSWSPSETPQVLSVVKDNPTTLYIYPESKDIAAVSPGGGGRPVALASWPLLEPLVPAGDRHPKILGEGDAGADHRQIRPGSSRTASAPGSDLQRVTLM
ncbi:hypothetical protein ACOJBM_39775 [Rhizobium beringeri]